MRENPTLAGGNSSRGRRQMNAFPFYKVVMGRGHYRIVQGGKRFFGKKETTTTRKERRSKNWRKNKAFQLKNQKKNKKR